MIEWRKMEREAGDMLESVDGKVRVEIPNPMIEWLQKE